MAALMKSVTVRALKFPSTVNFRINRCSRTPTLCTKSFSTFMSPPSKAIVYDQHGSPDSVTRLVNLPPAQVRENDVCVKMIAQSLR